MVKWYESILLSSSFFLTNRFDIADANVICNQLGYPGADHYYQYGAGSTGPILLSNIECGGEETNLGECAHSDWYPPCVHTEDVGVVCNKKASKCNYFDKSHRSWG